MVLNKKIFYILALESRPHLGKSSKGRPPARWSDDLQKRWRTEFGWEEPNTRLRGTY